MKRNKFSLSHYKLFSCDMGELIPCSVVEVLPGDTVQMSSSFLIRAAALLAPVMHPVHVRVHHWYVPYRLIWDDFESFITGGPDGMDASVYPTKTATPTVGTLYDYLGLPLGTSIAHSVLPMRAYQTIWNEFYRDQDLQSAVVVSTASGADSTTSATLQTCAWEKDYFTSARPWEQKGPAISIPLTGTAPVTGIGFQGTMSLNANGEQVRETNGTTPTYTFATNPRDGSNDNTVAIKASTGTAATTIPQVFADLSAVSGVTINNLREALALQRFEEARSRYGSRYTEYLRYLGVRSSDSRLQRPEYLGGGKQTIQFSEVLQTGVTTSGNAAGVGTMRGHGIGAMRSNRFRRFIEEHGVIMSLMSVRPRAMYMQGIPRLFNRRTKEDFWQRELETIGQQAVLNKEIYAAHATPDGTFGYQDRYDEYRHEWSSIAGEFRDTTLNFWHMAREFGSTPALNSTFVSCVPTERTFAVPSQDVIYVMANHSIQARRLLQKTGRSMTF